MKPWTITWAGHVWTDDDVLACDLSTVQALTRGSWEDCNPWAGPMQLSAMIVALEARASQREVAEVLVELRGATASALAESIRER